MMLYIFNHLHYEGHIFTFVAVYREMVNDTVHLCITFIKKDTFFTLVVVYREDVK